MEMLKKHRIKLEKHKTLQTKKDNKVFKHPNEKFITRYKQRGLVKSIEFLCRIYLLRICIVNIKYVMHPLYTFFFTRTGIRSCTILVCECTIQRFMELLKN